MLITRKTFTQSILPEDAICLGNNIFYIHSSQGHYFMLGMEMVESKKFPVVCRYAHKKFLIFVRNNARMPMRSAATTFKPLLTSNTN